jgi:hypothetical protein
MAEFTERLLLSESERATRLAMTAVEGWLREREGRGGAVGAGAGVASGEEGLEMAGAVVASGGLTRSCTEREREREWEVSWGRKPDRRRLTG